MNWFAIYNNGNRELVSIASGPELEPEDWKNPSGRNFKLIGTTEPDLSKKKWNPGALKFDPFVPEPAPPSISDKLDDILSRLDRANIR